MDGGNLLTGGVETLNEIKEYILELQGYQTNYDTLVLDEEKLEKNVKDLEKDISDEILNTTKKRRQEIEDTFDKQIDKIRARIKKTRDKRDKSKSSKVSERIVVETASLKDENSQLKLETKTIFKQKHVPTFCNTKYYYALYLPTAFADFLMILGTLLITLYVIPCGIYFFILPEEKVIYLILIYIITVLIFGGLYLMVGDRTKSKHLEEIRQVKGLRDKIRVNNKKALVIKRNILRDRDESRYGLESFDEELDKLEKETADIAEQKKVALGTFDNTTSQVIGTEIKGEHEEQLVDLKTQYQRVSGESRKAGDMIKALTIKIASEYEPFIGKDLMTLDRLDALINIIQAGSAGSVSEAVAFYKQGINGATQK